MNLKKSAFLVCLACCAPVVADATMIYVPANPCACDSRPCDNDVILSRDFRRDGVVQAKKTEPKQKKVVKQKQREVPQAWDKYVSVKLALNMWSWRNDYSSDYVGTDLLFSEDTYAFESVFGGGLAVGTTLGDGARAEIELGLTAEFEDKDEAATYTLSAPYLMMNAYRDFDSGFYIGAGLGVTKPKVSMTGLLFTGSSSGGETSETALKVAAMVGYSAQLNQNLFLDLQYKLAGFRSPEITRNFWWDQYNDGSYEEFMLKVKGGFLMENAISVGLRFKF